MAISGTGKAKRESAILFMDVGDSTAEYEAIGKDNDDLTRERNNEVEANKNVLGETEVTVTNGNQVTSVDPFKFRRESKIAQLLYKIDKENLDGSDVEKTFIEVFIEDKEEDGEYAAFKQTGAIDLKSWGGDTTAVGMPFDINWKGAREYGTFDPTTKTFTPTVSE